MKFLFKNEVIDYDFFNNKKQDTILFLHGWGGNKFSFVSTINLLKNQYNILSISMPTNSPTTSVWNLFDYAILVENILLLHSICDPIIVCHSFGFRVAMILNKKIVIKKIIVTGGAGLKKNLNPLKKIELKQNKIILNSKNSKDFFKVLASADYSNLSETNKQSFKNIVNLNLKFASNFACPMLLFWGTKDRETKLWIAKFLKKVNNADLIITKGGHFTFLEHNSMFNHEVLKFISQS